MEAVDFTNADLYAAEPSALILTPLGVSEPGRFARARPFFWICGGARVSRCGRLRPSALAFLARGALNRQWPRCSSCSRLQRASLCKRSPAQSLLAEADEPVLYLQACIGMLICHARQPVALDEPTFDALATSFDSKTDIVQDGPCRKRNNLLPSSSPFDRAVALPRASWHQRDTSRSPFRAGRRAEPPAPPPQTQASGCRSTDPRRSSPPRRGRIRRALCSTMWLISSGAGRPSRSVGSRAHPWAKMIIRIVERAITQRARIELVDWARARRLRYRT